MGKPFKPFKAQPVSLPHLPTCPKWGVRPRPSWATPSRGRQCLRKIKPAPSHAGPCGACAALEARSAQFEGRSGEPMSPAGEQGRRGIMRVLHSVFPSHLNKNVKVNNLARACARAPLVLLEPSPPSPPPCALARCSCQSSLCSLCARQQALRLPCPRPRHCHCRRHCLPQQQKPIQALLLRPALQGQRSACRCRCSEGAGRVQRGGGAVRQHHIQHNFAHRLPPRPPRAPLPR